MSRTYRPQYRGSRRVDRTCRSGGDCPWCQGNRTHATRRRELAADEQLAHMERCRAADESR